jgi:hypothetical protein
MRSGGLEIRRYLLGLRDKQPSSASQVFNIEQEVEGFYGSRLCISSISHQTSGVADGKHWQTNRLAASLNSFFERIFGVGVSIAGNEYELPILTDLPQLRIWDRCRDAQASKALHGAAHALPQSVPLIRPNRKKDGHLPFDIVVS